MTGKFITTGWNKICLSGALVAHFSRLSWCLIMVVLASTGLAGLAAHDANARLIVKEQTKNYRVTGKTGKQVHAKFGRGGPIKLRRKHAIAATQRKLSFDGIHFAQRGNRCHMTRRDVKLQLTYYYPNWVNKNRSSKKAQQTWNRFMKELVRHEKVHGKLFKESAKAIDRKLAQISKRKYPTCQAMRSAALREIKTIIRRGAAKHVAFDRREKRPTTKIRKLEKAFFLTK